MYKIALAVVLVVISTMAVIAADTRTMVLDRRPGLDKPITMNVRAASIREVLDTVEAQTNVRLRPDRAIAEDKATIYVKNKPAREVLRALAHCFNLSWVEGEIGGGNYLRLQSDRDSDAEMRKRHYDDFLAIFDQFDKELEVTAKFIRENLKFSPPDERGSMSPDEYERLMRRNRGTTWPEYGACMMQYLALSKSQRKDLMEGKHVSVTGSSIAKEARDRMPEVTSLIFFIDRSLGGYLLKCSVQPFIPTSLMVATAIFDDSRYDGIVKSSNESLLKDELLNKELLSKTEDKSSEQPKSETVVVSLAQAPGTVVMPVPRPGEGSGATPTTMSDCLLPIAQAADIPIVAQYVSAYVGAKPTPPAGKKAAEQLADICTRHRFTITKDGDFYLAKSLLWHRLYSREVPEENIRRWQLAITGLPLPTFEAFVEMSNLSWEQLRGVIAGSQYWFGIANPIDLVRCEYALKLYASLTPSQQRALWEGEKISAASMRSEQQHLFMQAYEAHERPTYEYIKDDTWPQRSFLSLNLIGPVSDQLVAVSDMRNLGTESIVASMSQDSLPPVSADMSPQHQQMMRNMQLQLAEEELPRIAKKLADRLAAENPKVPAKSIGVYANRRVDFMFELEGSAKPRSLTYCSKVTW